MRFREPDEGLPQVMVIPMIDIMFFLLVFFMIATVNMSDSGKMPIKLASMQQLQTTKIQGLEISVDKDNMFYVNHESIPSEKLYSIVKKAVGVNPELLVILNIDKNSRFASTADVINVLKQAGVKHMALSAEKRG
jgi:biopolymer transport protein ExbD